MESKKITAVQNGLAPSKFSSPQKVHFISIGGAAMHNLALEMNRKGCRVTGSDDHIVDPSRSRLQSAGLLPEEEGWFPDRITTELDAVILGMHARPDNPELRRAQELGLAIYSFPEFLYQETRNKRRIVISGSHGKTTITSIVLHVLKAAGKSFDYMVGAKIEGFQNMVGLHNQSKIAIFEGDEYLSSPIDRRPKFLLYQPNIALISGISWDHANVFPTTEIYQKQFEDLLEQMEPEGTVIYCEENEELSSLIHSRNWKLELEPYGTHPHSIHNGMFYLDWNHEHVRTAIFGSHNMQNIAGAKKICLKAGISEQGFYQAIPGFRGAARRLECLYQDSSTAVFNDFAHAPSKVKATIQAVSQLYPHRKLVACLELHTFSSLSSRFLPQYRSTMDDADLPIVFFDPQTLIHKKLSPLSPTKVAEAFGRKNMHVFTSREEVERFLKSREWRDCTLLLMSSGSFGGMDLTSLVQKIKDQRDCC